MLKLADNEHVFLLSQHHIISDGWSIGVFFNELSQLYTAYLQGKPESLPPLTIQYADYSLWQQQKIKPDYLKQQTEYWLSALNNAPNQLALLTDFPRPAQQDYKGSQIAISFDAELSKQIKTFSKRHNTTVFNTLLSSWAILLSRLANQAEVVIGTVSAHRNQPELEYLIGFFVNTLPIRINIGAHATVAELIDHVKSQMLAAHANQDIPFEQIVELLNPERSLAYAPLFQTMFAWQNMPQSKLTLPGLVCSLLEAETHETAKFDLSVSLEETDGLIFGHLENATRLFSRDTICRYLDYWQNLLKSLVKDDQNLIAQLPILNNAEYQTLVYDWNNTTTDYPKQSCISLLFEQQVLKTPENTAVIHNNGVKLTYAELNINANKLAHYLIQQGVVSQSRVAICLDRNLEFIIALLAILKIGAAYVPIDPNNPSERIKLILEDCTPQAFISVSEHLNTFRQLLDNIINIDLNNLSIPWSVLPENNLQTHDLSSESLAYIIYTSGTIGIPKGVMIPHRGISRLVINNGYLQINADDRVGFAANPMFDATTFEIWAPLLNGAAIVIIEQAILLAPALFAETLSTHQVSILWLTVGLFNHYVDDLSSCFKQLRYLLVGGEKLDPQTIAKVLKHSPPQHLLNGYGPTETTTFASTYEIASVPDLHKSIPIGRPIGNTQIYILDSYLQPVPIGIGGELYIGGDGVALGYLNKPDLTADCFLANPFSQQPNAKIYKTGDLGRWLADGTIEFLGRNDQQVKIRGFRIELGEIETVLELYPDIHQAVVNVQIDNNEKRLIAYYSGVETSAEALFTYLSTQLPHYMLPVAYDYLEKIPLTANGKIDRKSLPSPKQTAFVYQGYEAPLGDTEVQLAQLWSDLLKVNGIGRHDNFFELGGHSLLAINMLTQINQVFYKDLSLATVFEAPTIMQMANVIQSDSKSSWFSFFPIKKSGNNPMLFWIEYDSHQHYEVIKHIGNDQPVYGLRYGISAPRGSEFDLPRIEDWAAHYVDEIQRFQNTGPYYLMGFCYGGVIAYEVAQQLTMRGEKVENLFLLDSYVPNTPQAILYPISKLFTIIKKINIVDIVNRAYQFFKSYFYHSTLFTKGKFIPDQPKLEFYIGVLNEYHAKNYNGRVMLFKSDDSRRERLLFETILPEVAWRKLIGEQLETYDISGTHFDFLKGESAKEIAKVIKSIVKSNY